MYVIYNNAKNKSKQDARAKGRKRVEQQKKAGFKEGGRTSQKIK
jgi:hypothetical protein